MFESIQNVNLPFDEQNYLNKVCQMLISIVGDNLIGIYLVGSSSQNRYVKGMSDLDIQMVVLNKRKTESQKLYFIPTALVLRLNWSLSLTRKMVCLIHTN